MPSKPKASSMPPPVDHTEAIYSKGEAYTLAQLADTKGLTVAATLEFPKILATVGLTADMPHYVKLLAHQIHRDMVDAAHYRLAKTVTK